MQLTYVPLLRKQREIYDLPRDMNRFKTYLDQLRTTDKTDMELPLSAMNPMAKDAVANLIDAYITLDCDALAADAITQATSPLTPVAGGSFKVTLVMVDDAAGGWTNRYDFEFRNRFQTKAHHRRGWLTGMLWSSEGVSAENAVSEALCAAHRGAYIEQHGFAETLGDMLQQESYAMCSAGVSSPTFDSDELAYTQQVLEPYLDSDSYAVQFAAVFGDDAAKLLGYEPLGLSSRAGLGLALATLQ